MSSLTPVTHDDVRRYYDGEYYRDLSGGRPATHYDTYLNLLNVRSNGRGAKLLDVACGVGRLLERGRLRNLECSGIDISEKAVEFARQRNPDINFAVGQAENLPWADATFDFVTCLGSLEHFLDQRTALKEIMRVCKSNGSLLLMVPNSEYRFGAGTAQAVVKETLLSMAQWKEFFGSAGLLIREVTPDRYPLHWIPLPTGKPIELVKGLYRRSRFWCLPLRESYQFIFRCELPSGRVAQTNHKTSDG